MRRKQNCKEDTEKIILREDYFAVRAGFTEHTKQAGHITKTNMGRCSVCAGENETKRGRWRCETSGAAGGRCWESTAHLRLMML